MVVSLYCVHAQRYVYIYAQMCIFIHYIYMLITTARGKDILWLNPKTKGFDKNHDLIIVF